MYQINALYTLNLHTVLYQFYLNTHILHKILNLRLIDSRISPTPGSQDYETQNLSAAKFNLMIWGQQLVWRNKLEESDSRERQREETSSTSDFCKAQMHLHTFQSMFVQIFFACLQYLLIHKYLYDIFIFIYLFKYIFKTLSKYE